MIDVNSSVEAEGHSQEESAEKEAEGHSQE